MTKKHFIALADYVRTHKPITEERYAPKSYVAGQVAQWEIMRDMLADFCQSQNSQFNRERWLSYIAGECGPNGGELKHK